MPTQEPGNEASGFSSVFGHMKSGEGLARHIATLHVQLRTEHSHRPLIGVVRQQNEA